VAEGTPPSTDSPAVRLETRERLRLDRFDPVAAEFVSDLLARAEGLGGRARALLEARAELHLTRLEAAGRAASDRARKALDALGDDGRDPAGAEPLREALASGDPLSALRGARRLRAAGAGSAGNLRRRGSHRRYRDALADLQTELAARPPAAGDTDTGLLNGNRLAARILAEADAISPAWRRSLVASLFDLASLMHLPEPPPPRRRR
jgi:hypothetical protein